MNLDELETIKAAVAALEAHGYPETAETLKAVLLKEFAKVAESLRDYLTDTSGVEAARAQHRSGRVFIPTPAMIKGMRDGLWSSRPDA